MRNTDALGVAERVAAVGLHLEGRGGTGAG